MTSNSDGFDLRLWFLGCKTTVLFWLLFWQNFSIRIWLASLNLEITRRMTWSSKARPAFQVCYALFHNGHDAFFPQADSATALWDSWQQRQDQLFAIAGSTEHVSMEDKATCTFYAGYSISTVLYSFRGATMSGRRGVHGPRDRIGESRNGTRSATCYPALQWTVLLMSSLSPQLMRIVIANSSTAHWFLLHQSHSVFTGWGIKSTSRHIK